MSGGSSARCSMGVSVVRSCFNPLQGDNGSSVLWCLPASIPLQGDSVSSVVFYGCVGGVPLLLLPCRWSMVHRLGGVSLGEMWRFIGRVLWVCRWCVPASISCRLIVVHRLGVCQCRGDMAVIWRCGSVCPCVPASIPCR